MCLTHAGIFVYGTLKHGEKNCSVAVSAGLRARISATLPGFCLYDLPRGWPCIIPGMGVVVGEILCVADLAVALSILDPFEDVGTEFVRLSSIATVRETHESVRVWTYAYPDAAAVANAGGMLVASGVWPPLPPTPSGH